MGGKMDKSNLNFLIDILMFLTLMTLAGLGLLIKYVLIPGRTAWAKYGVQVDIIWLGLDRHAWGEVHLYLAFLLLSLLALHVILHGKIILGFLTRFISQPALRMGMASVFFLVGMTLLALPLLVTPEVNEVGSREDLGLSAPTGMEEFSMSAVNPGPLERERTIDLASQSGAREQGANVTPQSKSPRKKIHSSVWPKKPYNKADYRRHRLSRQGKRTTPLITCCQPPRRWSP